MNVRQIIFGILLGLFLGMYDVVFSSFVPGPLSFLHLSLPIIAFCIAIERGRLAFVIAIAAGLVFDLFAIGSSGFAVARMSSAAGVAWLLQAQVLTNRSLYATILLACVVRVVDTLWIWVVSFLLVALNRPMILSPTWNIVWKRAGMDFMVVAVLFFIQMLMKRQFRRRP